MVYDLITVNILKELRNFGINILPIYKMLSCSVDT